MTRGVDFPVYGVFVEDMCSAPEAWGLVIAVRIALLSPAFSLVNKGYFQELGRMTDIMNPSRITVQCL